jgi:hypothetical protein
MKTYHEKIWDNFCSRYGVREKSSPLFENNNNVVNVIAVGRDKRLFLKRSTEMESNVIHEVKKVLADHKSGDGHCEGLIYMMYRLLPDRIVPLYIGKAEKYGKNGGNLSENIRDIERNAHKFCRWGYGYAYHIGDLSAIVCPGHQEENKRAKYTRWANALFEDYPSKSPRLRFPVYFWIHAWKKGKMGIWEEFGETSLTFLEYLLIGVASRLFPNDMLNQEGINRI